MKGTVWYLSDVVIAITSLFMVLFMLFIAAVVLFVTNLRVDVDVLGFLLFEEPRVDNMLLAYMDTTVDGHSMAELLAYGVASGSDGFVLDGKQTDLTELSGSMMPQLTTRTFSLTLELSEGKKVLASRGKVMKEAEIVSRVPIVAGGNEADLVLEVGKT
jgi:hypothetical protein